MAVWMVERATNLELCARPTEVSKVLGIAADDDFVTEDRPVLKSDGEVRVHLLVEKKSYIELKC